ncbi:PIN domain-containing protein [Leptolyngbya sp. 15MV]|nr:PIN domain-containing protein [Leptolyngbya sp. 15MV]
MSRVALDSNILVYLAGLARVEEDRAKTTRVRQVIRTLESTVEIIAPVQTLGELYVVLRRNKVPPAKARNEVGDLAEAFGTAPSVSSTLLAALDLAADHRLQFWDSLILTAAQEANCTLLLSEDMQDGFAVGGLTVVNPLASEPHPMLARLLRAEA